MFNLIILKKHVTVKGLLLFWFTIQRISAVPVKDNFISSLGGSSRPVEGGQHPPIPPGSDTGLYNENLIEGDILVTKTQPNVKNAIADKSHLWPYGVVIYKVDESVGCPFSPQCKILAKAMNHYHTKSCIRFKEWTGEFNFVHIFFNTDNSGACWSPVGRVGAGEQRLSLGHRCWYLGIVIHELGHAIGFWHEMNRPDRDSWIKIYWDNIIEGFKSAFYIQDQTAVDTLGESFDYKSIMMYDEYAFSKTGRSPTLQAKTGEEIGPIWKKKGLSASDIRRLQKLYKCNGNKMIAGFPNNVTCDFNTNTCGFRNGPVSAWQWKTVNSTDGFLYTSYETAGTNPASLSSVNFHSAVLRDDDETPLGCIKFSYLLRGDGNMTIKLLQVYLAKVTELTVDANATFDLWSNKTVANKWSQAQVPFYITRPFKLIFESNFETGANHGTIALDNIEVKYTPCDENTDFKPPSTQKPDQINAATLDQITTIKPPKSEVTKPLEIHKDQSLLTNEIRRNQALLK